MVTELHRRAEGFMGEGDAALARDEPAVAESHYRAAAELEAAAFEEVALDKPITRGVLAVSSVALFRKAGDVQAAIRQGHRVLSLPGLSPRTSREVEVLLDELRTEALAGLRAVGPGYEWALRGGRVGYGVARLETLNRKTDQIQRYSWRVFEWLNGDELRTNRPPSPEVRQAVDLLVSQPVAGSFAFTVRVADQQLSLPFDADRPRPTDVDDAIGAVLKAAQADDEQVIHDVIPDSRYRRVLMRMVRDLAPDGHEIEAIEVRRVGERRTTALLTPVVKAFLGRRLRRDGQIANEPSEIELRDTLRVIDLNRSRIGLGPKDEEQWCRVPQDLAIVDLVAGLEDQPVRVRGHRQGKSFMVHDLERDNGEEE